MQINLRKGSRHLQNLLLFCLLTLGTVLHAQAIISGRITLPDGVTPFEGVAVSMTGTSNSVQVTDANGQYSFTAETGGSYAIRPLVTANHLNGVTTLDIVLAVRHMAGVELLDSPYKRIAADVDDSYTIDTQDTLIMRQLIYGFINTFPGNESFRFIPASYVFPDPANPFPYPTAININNLSGNQTNSNFIGVKLGDLNYTALTVGGAMGEPAHFNAIMGKALLDDNSNCAHDPSETPLANWLVVASGPAGEFVTYTKNDGSYNIPIQEGNYTVALIRPNDLWNVCTTPQFVQVGLADTVIVPFSGQVDKYCPRMEVDLSTSFLRRCFPNYYSLQYCNKGTVPVENAYVELDLDPFMTLQSSSMPWSAQSGNNYTFQVGNVDVGECGTIQLLVSVSCDAVLGHTHCSTAHIFPDTVCGPVNSAWDGANLRVTGACNGNEVKFTITNEGEDMTQTASYVIIEDIMIQMEGASIQLDHGSSETFTVPANGSTWRLEIDQTAHHPLSLQASAAVEGCGTNSSGAISQGFVTLFPQDDATFFEDVDCVENIGSYDPNDKQGFPRGVGAEHFIPKGEEIEYLIRFQNTGTDTAFTVMILDTLSTLFDLSTLRPGASSHPYTFNLLGQGVAQFVFSNIMLPDSNVNEAASHGFVKLTISPKTGLPDNTQLENQAGIYFDFNDPVITNRTLHTIGEQYLEVTRVANLQPDVALDVFPNPARTEATFRLKTTRTLAGTLFLYDMQGREVKRLPFADNSFKINVSQLPTGQYFFRVDAGGKGLSTGKLSIEK
ncbi:MAG: T9SS type A sorting domain-containing protein [Saprospiraceae bacterium]|nr:T9SS type A sorting domain-containing protein [Saprospiraceae bacterium]